jgi:hypothetical protein
LDTNWKKNVEIQIGSNPNHTITRIQYPIQLSTNHIIHHAQGLTFDHLILHPIGVIKHGFTYITLSHNDSREHLYLLSPLSNNFFYANFIVD